MKATLLVPLLLAFNLCIRSGDSMSFWEFLIGPKLKTMPTSERTPKADAPPRAQDLANNFGYPFETHQVVSPTGHILELHRIPGSPKCKSSDQRKPVTLIHHGFLATSDGWLFRGPDFDLPYTLVDNGYDVWLCNARGNFYSRKHINLNPDTDEEYWMFSLHEMGHFDLPVVIDYVLNKTDQDKLQYIGHSMGSTVLFILCSTNPLYNKKISHHVALGPLANITHELSSMHRILLNLVVQLVQTTMSEKIYEIMPRRAYFSKMIEMLCSEDMPTKRLCLSSIFAIVGDDISQFDESIIPKISSYYPAGTSVFVLFHILEMMLKREFKAFDYDKLAFNVAKYNSTVPPEYNMSLVTSPTSIHYGNGDSLITREDVNSIAKRLPNVVGIFKVPHEEFNHLDFFWAREGKTLLYNKLVKLMNKYR